MRIILITGHPATGKTTLAHRLARDLMLPLIAKDDLKELLYETLGWGGDDWSRKLSVAAWALLYHQVDRLLEAGIDHVVEANFNPTYADAHWQQRIQRHQFDLVQVQCKCDPDIALARYSQRIADGSRHQGHVDDSRNAAFHARLRQGPLAFVDVPSEHISLDTSTFNEANYRGILDQLNNYHARPKEA